MAKASADLLGSIFDLFDFDASGFIEEKEGLEVAFYLEKSNADKPAYWAKMLADMDTDGDGKVSRDEFIAFHAEMSAKTATQLKSRLLDKGLPKAPEAIAQGASEHIATNLNHPWEDYEYAPLGEEAHKFKLGSEIEELYKAWSEASEGDDNARALLGLPIAPGSKAAKKLSLAQQVAKEIDREEHTYQTADAYDDYELMGVSMKRQQELVKWAELHGLELTDIATDKLSTELKSHKPPDTHESIDFWDD